MLMKKRLTVILCVITLIAAVLPVTVVSADAKTLTHVVITPTSSNLLYGATQQFTARGEDVNNEAIDGLTYTWAVVNGGGTINGSGLFTAGTTALHFENTIKVTAVQGQKSVTGFASVTVFAAVGNLDHIVISPTTVTLAVGGTQQFTAQGQDANNLPITGLTYVWSANGGGSISGSGLFAATTLGIFNDTVQVYATINNTIKAKASVKVVVLTNVVISPTAARIIPGGTQQFTAQGQDTNNLPIAGLTYVWSVDAVISGGTIDTSSGLFTAGTTTGTFTDTVKVTVQGTAIFDLATVIVKIGANQNKSGFFPWGWEHGLKKGWNKLHFPPGWYKNCKATQDLTGDENTSAARPGKGNQNNKKDKR